MRPTDLPLPTTNDGAPIQGAGNFRAIVEAIAAELADLLAIPTPAPDLTLLELGGHSLQAMALRVRLEQRYSIQVRVADVVQRGSAAQLAKCVLEALEAQTETATSNEPLSARGNEASFPASEAQRAIYLATLRSPIATLYNTPIAVELSRRVKPGRLARALRALSARHDALRLHFCIRDDVVFQVVSAAGPVPFSVQAVPAEDRLAAMERFAAPFDLDSGPLWRAALFDDGSEHPTLLMDFHHLVMDGSSVPTLLRDLLALLDGEVLHPANNYRAAIEADASRRGTSEWREAQAYWRERATGGWPAPSLPSIPLAEHASESASCGAILHMPVAASLMQVVERLASEQGTTLHCVFLTVLHVLLAKLTREPEATVGVPMSGRISAVTDDVVGLFVRTLPSKHRAAPERAFLDLLSEVHAEHLKRLEYQFYPLRELDSPDAVPAFEVVMATQRFRADCEQLGHWRPFHYPHAHFPLLFELTECEGNFTLTIEYDETRFDHGTVADMAASYLHLCEQACASPNAPIASLSMLTRERALAIATRFNPLPAVRPLTENIVLRFAAVARRHADGVALLDVDRTVSYAELDEVTDRVAQALRLRGLARGDKVALLSERRLDYVVAQLAILKCGAAYVPLDPDHPAARLSMMATRAGCRFVLSLEAVDPGWPVETLSWAHLLVEASSASGMPSMHANSNARDAIDTDDIAYVMFTSGSTGLPKAVGVTHRNVLRLVEDGNVVPLHEDTRLLLTGSPSFDATTFEVWGPLLAGGSVALVDKTTLLDASLLRAAIERFHISVLFLTSPLFARLVQQMPDLLAGVEYLITGGDFVALDAVQAVQRATPATTVVNAYGPTENTTYSTLYAVPRGIATPIPVGRPIARSTGYVLDEGGNLLPPFAIGELHVGGEGVAFGYLGDPATTSAKFYEHRWPFGRSERLYRTGDLAYWNREGIIHLRGRVDAQVKVRGYRVEPGEVRDAIRACAGVSDAYVGYVRDGSLDGLAAWIVADKDDFDAAAVLGVLRNRLPDHMVPTLIAEVDALPLNVNGKVAREHLTAPLSRWSAISTAPAAELPLTPSQRAIASLWCEILGCDSVGLDDSFFALGGDSFTVHTLASRLAVLIGERPSIVALFRQSTVREQAAAFASRLDAPRSTAAPHSPTEPPAEPETRFLASEAQARLFALDRVTEGRAPYLIPVLLRVDGSLDASRLQLAWSAVCRRHTFLRSRFSTSGNETWIDIAQTGGPLLAVEEIDHQSLDNALSVMLRPCSLEQGDVARATLFRSAHGHHWLALVFHHVAFDGAAIELILADIARAYRNEPLRPPALSVSELWAAREYRGEARESTRRWWVKHLADAPLEVQLPADHVRQAEATFAGETISRPLQSTLRERVRRMAAQMRVTPYTIYLATLLLLLRAWSRQSALTVGIVSNGRQEPGSEDIAGMQVHTLPVHFEVDDASAFRMLVAQVQDRVIDAIEHQHVSLADLLAALARAGGGNRPRLFNVMFSMVAFDALPALGDDISLHREEWRYPSAKFDLTFFVHEDGNASRLALEYAVDLFAHDTAERLLSHLENLLARVTADDPVQSLSFITETERLHVLHALNDTATPYDRAGLIHRLFERSADRNGQAIAVIQGATSFTYAQLEDRANRLASLLAQEGVGPRVPVLIMMDRTPDMIVAVMGVLKAGGYYVPVEPELPTERVRAIAVRLGIEHLVTNASALALRAGLWADGLRMSSAICIDAERPISAIDHAARWLGPRALAACPATRAPAPTTCAEETAYVIFTSGSTGEPKGVEVRHRSVINLIEWVNGRYHVNAGDRLLFVTSLSFDLSVYDIFGTLAAGAAIRVATREEAHDPHRMLEILRRENITFWDSAPAAFDQLLQVTSDELISSDLRLVFLSGDWISVSLPARLVSRFPAARLIALGGATEATIWSNYFEVPGDTRHWVSIPYGRPIQNARYYVLDPHGHPCPVGLPGRLFIGGECLAAGYAGAPELTASRFIRDPFVDRPDAVMYDTGDIARWRPDGQMQFLGRDDHQVKIRGYRIELGEITYWLLRHPAVRDAVVLPQPDAAGTLALVAHVIANATVTPEVLANYLAARLPVYMVPAWFSFVDTFPVTSNGKLDRSALPRITELACRTNGNAEPTDDVECEIQRLWCEVLCCDEVPVDTAFQMVGGNSVTIVRLHGLLDARWPSRLSVPDLFALATVRAQAARIREWQTADSRETNRHAPGQETLETLLSQVRNGELDTDQALRLLGAPR